MAYQQDIPQPSEIPSQSQADLLGNFQAINSSTEGFGLDHVQFDAVSDKGKHQKSTYIEQGSDPTTAANEMCVYAKEVTYAGPTTNTELFLAKESAGTVIQMSQTIVDPLIASNGSTFLPGGVLIKWGILNSPVDNSTVTFTSAFPNNIWNIQLTPVKSDNTARSMYVKTGTAATTGFTIQTSSSNFTSVYWLAIGN